MRFKPFWKEDDTVVFVDGLKVLHLFLTVWPHETKRPTWKLFLVCWWWQRFRLRMIDMLWRYRPVTRLVWTRSPDYPVHLFPRGCYLLALNVDFAHMCRGSVSASVSARPVIGAFRSRHGWRVATQQGAGQINQNWLAVICCICKL